MKKFFYLLLLVFLASCGTSENDDPINEESEGSFTVSGSISASADKYPLSTQYIVTPGVVSGVTVAIGNIGQTDDVVTVRLLGDGSDWDNTTYTDDPDLSVLPNIISLYANEDNSYQQDPDVRSTITFSQVGATRVKGTFSLNLIELGGTDKISVNGEFDDLPND